MVGFAPSVSASDRSEARTDAGVEVVRALRLPGVQLVRTQGTTVAEAVAELEASPEVRYAEPNYVYRATALTNDARFDELWGLRNTGQTANGVAGLAGADANVHTAWNTFTGAGDPVIAIVDTGIAYDHPDLAGNVWSNPGETPGNGVDDDGNGYVDDVHGTDVVDRDGDPRDLQYHGTHVAGTVAAVGGNGMGITGVAQRARLMGVRALNAAGNGTNAAIAEGFGYAADNGARIVNASLGGPSFSQTMQNVVATHPEALYVVSAGNDAGNDDSVPAYPCSYTPANLVCVAATDQSDGLAGFSNYGATAVDLGAPGVDILSTLPARQTVFTDGFEANDLATRWSRSGTNNSWARSDEQHASGSYSLNDSPGATYLPGSSSVVYTAAKLDLRGKVGCKASFRIRLALANDQDRLRVVVSGDGQSFTSVVSYLGTTNGFGSVRDLPLNRDGQQVHFGFRLDSDGAGELDGAHLDDLSVTCASSTYGATDYGFLDGTSMATPHVAGAAALILGARPGTTTAQLKGWLLDTGKPLPALAGKTVTGRRLDVAAALLAGEAQAPVTTFASAPSGTVGPAPTFAFSSSEAGSTFSCRLDAGAWAPCTSPTTLSGLAEGDHAFSVRATDADGNVRLQPASRGFRVDATAPDTTIDSGPVGTIASAGASFAFSSEAGARFECQVDGGAWAACASPAALSGLGDGEHSFSVRAIDAVGNTDASAATRAFTVATAPASTSAGVAGPPAPPRSNAPVVPPAAQDTVGPVVVVPAKSKSLTASKAGVVAFGIGPLLEDVTGTISLRTGGTAKGKATTAAAKPKVVALGSATFQGRKGKALVVKVKLGKAGRALLKRQRRLAVKAVIVMRDARGNATTRTYALTVKVAKRK